ncbi:MAG TPA: hypothetical protein VE944_28430 [Nostoc sp.]|uniref:hypothetical protein n=1 Tax=Nostoc sp. TaxID=1180 RepID=UPI002D5E33E4|nr:hypothetical protein [Nostoc sp.]HYX18225.1 hypothetical protein [Nostoc sp.]
MPKLRNATERLGTFRQLHSSLHKAIDDGYYVVDDTGKLNLLKKAEETGVPSLLKKFWALQHGCELPSDDELLQSAEVKELFSPPEKTPRERRNSTS